MKLSEDANSLAICKSFGMIFNAYFKPKSTELYLAIAYELWAILNLEP